MKSFKNPSTAEKDNIRRRDRPMFAGMRRHSSSLSAQRDTTDPQDVTNSSLSGSLSEIWDLESKGSATQINQDAMNLQKLSMNPEFDKLHLSSSARQANFSTSMRMSTDRHLPYSMEKIEHSVDDGDVVTKSTYNGNKMNMPSHKISLPPSAALYYCRNSLLPDVSVSEVCKSISKLNYYLKTRKTDVKAGVPGKYLHALIGQELTDVGSVVSIIMYAYFLNETQKNNQFCTVPIINIKRADFSMHTEIKWLFQSCHIDESSLIFIDEIDLSYYDLFGNLKLVLLNGHKLPIKQEGLKEALVEIFNCKEVEPQYPWVEEVTIEQETVQVLAFGITAGKTTVMSTVGISIDCSCCTLIAEKFAENIPEILAGKGFSKLLLSSILLDTGNLTDSKCTSKDKYMATLLIKGAGRLGSNGLYQMLRYKMFDISDLKVRDILRRDFKKWTRVAGKPTKTGSRLTIAHIGMSSIGISVEQLLAHEDSAAKEVIQFQESEKLRLLMVVSGYEDIQKKFKREILVSAHTAELMRNFSNFLDAHGTHLPLKSLDQSVLREEMRAFEIDSKMTSRRSIEQLLEDFGGLLRKQSSLV